MRLGRFLEMDRVRKESIMHEISPSIVESKAQNEYQPKKTWLRVKSIKVFAAEPSSTIETG